MHKKKLSEAKNTFKKFIVEWTNETVFMKFQSLLTLFKILTH